MAIKTTWPVQHTCGHREDHDLSATRPSERGGHARSLATKDCTDIAADTTARTQETPY